jgi:DNA-binding response OmpR family regulator
MRILIIEPDRKLATVLEKSFKQAGFAVQLAHDGQTAVSKADDQRPNAVLCELALPGQNGVAFLQEFRSYQDWLDVPVFVYSQIPCEDTGLSARGWHKLGVHKYLYKPTTRLKDLHYAINQSLTNYETA